MYPAIIDRYLLRQYFWTALITAIGVVGLFVIFDGFTNLEEFLRAAEKHGGLLPLLARYYASQAVMVFDRSASLVTLIAAMFTITWIQRHNEMTALLAAGIPRWRVILPVGVASAAIIFLAAANREIVIPQLRDQLAQRPQDLIGDRALPFVPRFDRQTNILFRGRACYREGKRIAEPNLLLPPELGRLGRQLSAQVAFYQPAGKAYPSGYLLKGVNRPANIAELPSVWLGDSPVIITPRDAPNWLKPDECFVVTSIDFDQLCGGTAFRQFSSTASLIRALRNASLDLGADIRVTIHARIVQPLADFTLLFLGLPLVIQRENRNVFAAIALCTVLTAAFFVVSLGFQQLGAAYYIAPALAAWGPLMIFVPVASVLAETIWE
ncbi:MAG: LptF/LptG family permease [Thermoguttaceae bacterium]|nr:LptF/LptG family permease [Thermoguttaceae bacterium]